MSFGNWDIRTYIEKSGDKHKFDQYQGQMWEHGLQAVEQVEMNWSQNPRRTTSVQYIIICDVENLQLRQLASFRST